MKAAPEQKPAQHQSRPAAEPDRNALSEPDALFVDNRSEAIVQRTFADAINTSPRQTAQRRAIAAINTSPYMAAQRQHLRGMFGTAVQLKGPEDEELQMKAAPDVLQRKGLEEEELVQGKFAPVQRAQEEEEELLQGKFAPVQRHASEEDELLQGKFDTAQRQGPEEEELLQGKFAGRAEPAQLKDNHPRQENRTGMPDNLKAGVESLSGISLDHVKVHYNSAQPAQLNALAYAQGSDIHLAPGQEQHLPHEAWHVVQQAQGRVQPTMQMKDGVPVNDDAGLEREADVMGAKAAIAVNMSDPSGIFQRRAESAEAHPQLEPTSGQGEKAPLNFLSSALRLSALQRTADAFAASRTPPVQRLTADGTDYTPQEIGAAAAHARNTVTKKKAKDTDYAKAMADHLLGIGQATNYTARRQLENACKDWWNRPSSYEVAAEPEAREALDEPTIEYGAEHGDLHFIDTPTDKKAAWTIEKGTALKLMEAAIGEHLTALGENSATGESRDGWSAFYITVDRRAETGVYWVPKSERNKNKFPTTTCFTIQLQVNYAVNRISYHGYPDERMEGRLTGCSKTKGGAPL